MDLSPTMIVVVIALLVSVSATYNAYVLRGGKLALSQVLMALGTVCLMLSLVLPQSQVAAGFLQRTRILGASLVDVFSIVGFLLLFGGSLRLRYSLK